MVPKFGFLVLLVSQMASPPNKFVTQMVAPPNKSIKWCHHNIINLLKVVTPFGWLFYLVVTPFGRQVVRENQTLEPFLEYKMDSNENFSCHSVISRFKWTKYQFLSDQCRVPLTTIRLILLKISYWAIELILFQLGNFLIMSLVPVLLLTVLNYLIFRAIKRSK